MAEHEAIFAGSTNPKRLSRPAVDKNPPHPIDWLAVVLPALGAMRRAGGVSRGPAGVWVEAGVP
jgi:hypothetical protein